jgi:hypothetical protein
MNDQQHESKKTMLAQAWRFNAWEIDLHHHLGGCQLVIAIRSQVMLAKSS